MKFNWTISSMLVLAAGLSCARKPAQLTEDKALDSAYEKSEFEGKTFTVGAEHGNVGTFIDAALKKDQPLHFNLLAEQNHAFALMKKNDRVQFKIYEDALRMYYADNLDRPIAEWSISDHCRLDVKTNSKGEKTRFNALQCNDGKDFNQYNFFKANWNSVKIRTIAEGYENLVPTADIVSSANKFKINTGKYIDKNIQASRVWDEKLQRWRIKGSALSLARELLLPEGFNDFNVLAPVEFKSDVDKRFFTFDSQALADVEVLGAEDTEYKLRLKLTENHLLVQKVVSSAGLATTERTYAEDLGNEQFAVTIAGFPIQRYKLDNALVNGVRSVGITAISAPTLAEADMVAISEDRIQKFGAAENKLDTFGADFLADGSEWYYEKTIVGRPVDSAGNNLPFEFELGAQWESGRLRVNKTKTSVQMVDVNIPAEAVDVSGDEMQTKLEIPAKWIDYRVVTTGSNAYLQEEVLNDGHPAANQWDKRKWVNFEFNRADNTRDSRSDSYKLNKLEVGPDYVGFEVFESDKLYPIEVPKQGGEPGETEIIQLKAQATFKYSLHKAKPSIEKGRTYFASDRHDFGFFAATQQTFGGTTKQYEDVKEQLVNLSRMYPVADERNGGKPTIWFYITNNSPDEPYIVEATKDAVKAWDDAFHNAAVGSGREPISVKLADERVELGDVRYNKVAYYGYDRSSSLLGYGPQVADPTTGEIHTSTNHIYLRNYREGIWRSLGQYIRFELGQYEGKEVKGIVKYNSDSKKYESLVPNQVLSAEYNTEGSAGAVLGYAANSDFDAAKNAMLSAKMMQYYGMKPNANPAASLFFTPLDVSTFDYSHNDGQIAERALQEVMQDFATTGMVNLHNIMKTIQPTAMDAIDFKGYMQRLNGSVPAYLEVPAIHNDPNNWATIAANGCTFGYEAANANTIENIKKYCDNDSSNLLFKKYMDDLRSQLGQGFDPGSLMTHTAEEEAAFTSCSDILLKQKMVATLVHEFGHNFGLRHNFAGSTDVNNFPRTEDGQIKFMTSTAMEYLGNDDDRGYEAGNYDIAALRYGYYDTVEVVPPQDLYTSKPELVTLKGRSIEKAIEVDGKGLILKPYAYCTDNEYIGNAQLPVTNPNCRKWDRGVTPTEIVNDFIDFFNAFMTTNAYRFDNAGLISSENVNANLINKVFVPLKAYYDYYRLVLDREQGKTDPYLTKSTEAKVDQFVADHGTAELKELHKASKIIYDFLKAVAFSPVSYCAVTGPDGPKGPEGQEGVKGQQRFFEYELTRQKIYDETYAASGVGLNITSCEDGRAYFATHMKLKADELKVAFVGDTFNDVPYSPADEALIDRPDIQRGTAAARAGALFALTTRWPTSVIAGTKGYVPSFLDLDRYRQDMMQTLSTRIVLGESKPLLLEDGNLQATFEDAMNNKKPINLSDFFVNSFQRESDFLVSLYSSTVMGAQAPKESQNRIGQWVALKTASNSLGGFAQSVLGKQVEDPLKALTDAGFNYVATPTTYYFANQRINPLVHTLIDTYNNVSGQIQALEQPTFQSEQDLTTAVTFMKALAEELNKTITLKLAINPNLTPEEAVAMHDELLLKTLTDLVNGRKIPMAIAQFLYNTYMDGFDSFVDAKYMIDAKKLATVVSTAVQGYLDFYNQTIDQLGDLDAQKEMIFKIVTTTAQ